MTWPRECFGRMRMRMAVLVVVIVSGLGAEWRWYMYLCRHVEFIVDGHQQPHAQQKTGHICARSKDVACYRIRQRQTTTM